MDKVVEIKFAVLVGVLCLAWISGMLCGIGFWK
jgi:hypothetical protein